MKRTFASLVLGALVLVGAGCKPTPVINTATTNVSVVTNMNTSVVTNTGTTTGTFSTNTSVTTNTNTAATATVTVSSNGVSPKTLTVAAGTKVIFLNTDIAVHSVNSNPHPDHTDLPGFGGTAVAGGSSSFTFTQRGSWGYHDHESPFTEKFKGTITVQ